MASGAMAQRNAHHLGRVRFCRLVRRGDLPLVRLGAQLVQRKHRREPLQELQAQGGGWRPFGAPAQPCRFVAHSFVVFVALVPSHGVSGLPRGCCANICAQTFVLASWAWALLGVPFSLVVLFGGHMCCGGVDAPISRFRALLHNLQLPQACCMASWRAYDPDGRSPWFHQGCGVWTPRRMHESGSATRVHTNYKGLNESIKQMTAMLGRWSRSRRRNLIAASRRA